VFVSRGVMETISNITDFKEELREDVLIIRLKGRLDAISSPAVEKRIFEAINKGQEKILVDLTSLTYLSSSGMRMFLSITKMLRTLSGKLIVCNTPVNVLDILKMSGFDHVLELVATEQEALKHF